MSLNIRQYEENHLSYILYRLKMRLIPKKQRPVETGCFLTIASHMNSGYGGDRTLVKGFANLCLSSRPRNAYLEEQQFNGLDIACSSHTFKGMY